MQPRNKRSLSIGLPEIFLYDPHGAGDKKWHPDGLGINKDDGEASFFMLELLSVSGGSLELREDEVVVLELGRENEEEPYKVTFHEYPPQLGLAFIVPKELAGRLRLSFGDADVKLPEPEGK